MKTLSTTRVFSTAMCIQTASRLYRAADTVRFLVLYSGDRQTGLSSCNAALSFWIQRLDGNVWHDHDSINIGPCLGLYGPIRRTEHARSLLKRFSDHKLKEAPIFR